MKKKIPKELDVFVDKVLAYKPKPGSKGAKKRAERVTSERITMKRAAD